ncbi:hypothetical protein CPB83DRAFT_858754 [Crepidotus variabilis]|uniref:TECPR1-like DysF domain-containing protein n=1 Tax=Crepidotus variabilis TaxID=179855 RepID=A0A9P6JMN9_9AGAR|nr:hypothetical protein CPB83DRAFT_858754 [Crepidotus variabilis]
MATFEYIEIPAGATRLRAVPKDERSQPHQEMRPAPKISTSLPNPSPPSSPNSLKRRASLLSSGVNSVTSPTLGVFPQLLLSAALPPMTPTAPSGGSTSMNPRRKLEPDKPLLLSSKDPLSLPIMTNNFKRFIMVVGPVFWLQDRVEEIVMWKRGWLWTSIWMAAYSLLCFYPRLLFLLPHLVLIGVILSTYPYPSTPTSDPLYASSSSENAEPTDSLPQEGSASWQANIQGIQNLMGTYADLHAAVEPHLYHFHLTPTHISPTTRKRSNSLSSSAASSNPTTTQRSPYTRHILALLVLSFFPLLFVLHLPIFPVRAVCLFGGLAPFFLTHPYVQAVAPVLWPVILDYLPIVVKRAAIAKDTAVIFMSRYLHFDLNSSPRPFVLLEDSNTEKPPSKPLPMILQWIIDDDRLSDACWNSEMREVELWENERFGGPPPVPASPDPSGAPPPLNTTGGSTSSGALQKGWSKQNLRVGERTAWTRGRDGWSGIAGGGGGISGVEGSGEVSSNLTFSLAAGWLFVESEDWRKDLQCAWSGCEGDADGWVYTNDTWLGARPGPYTSGGGSLTRRRRWTRRVWYDSNRAKQDS